MHVPLPITRDLVLVGGGHSHALVLRSWGMRPLAGVRVTVINPGPTAPYSGMLPGLVAGHYRREELEIDLVKLARFAGARVVLGRAEGIDRDARLIHVPGRAPIYYDLASVDIGITSDLPALPGFTDHAVPAKPLGAFASRWQAFVAQTVAGKAAPRVAVIGAGVAGVELALACKHRLAQEGVGGEVALLEAGPEPLRDIGKGARAALSDQIAAQGVSLMTAAAVSEVTADGVVLQDGRQVEAALVIGAAGAAPQGWLDQTGLALTNGFIDVGADLRATSDPLIYAVGDCAHLTHDPRPKAGVFAVREAPVLLHNLRADLSGGKRREYHPQKDYLKLMSTGGKHAVADKLGLRLEGDWLWRWKNQIDRSFMRKFHELPQMDPPKLPTEAADGLRAIVENGPICGGCAAKAAADVLHDGVGRLGDDAALISVGGAELALSTDHFRAFWADPYVLTQIAVAHALGDIWAMGGQPRAVLSQVTLPTASDRVQRHMLREITAAARAALGDIPLVGGHSAVGAELMVGFTALGQAGAARRVTGAQVGDALILTKPLGSGTLFAAEMQGKADGGDIARALQTMARPVREDAVVLAPMAHAMTDVTGFGLGGHLLDMLRDGGLDAELVLNDVPLMQGAAELAAAGVRSSLYPKNAELLQAVGLDTTSTPRAALLADPQTAGGLLAAVPNGDAAMDAMQKAGLQAWKIGLLTEGTGKIKAR
ncbi:segregation protein B [Actibacterium mucosum KCTC 23349]|uniref:Segregation protein B n=1 Tax=Actibacterium mucosum KCTC 23349 TaxID=1454373 RepID=A0A037ZEQ1_9RHOB|nr:selenide, water dikinase SelD [Actibacterium mucosum]KAJ54930.1 segregation protein B [Actibacterium mucosum KCTC 23349]